MAQEFETKVLEIDADSIKSKLKKLGAEEEPEVKMRRWVFDMNPKGYEWIRLRDNGKNITLAYKCKKGRGISDTEEIEVEVKDFDRTFEILCKMPFKAKYYRESRRKLFRLKDIEFTIDTWPGLSPLLEIEASSEKRVREGLAMLGLAGKDIGNVCMKDVFKMKGIDLDTVREMRF